MALESIAAGFGFELDEADVLFKCREDLIGTAKDPADPDTIVHLTEANLRLLAFPFCPDHQRSHGANPAGAA